MTLETNEEAPQAKGSEKGLPGPCKGPEVGVSSGHSQNGKEISHTKLAVETELSREREEVTSRWRTTGKVKCSGELPREHLPE